MSGWQIDEVLKRDSFGRVERLVGPEGYVLRRVACGGRIPCSAFFARLLMRRERLALNALSGLEGTPELLDPCLVELPTPSGRALLASNVLLRKWVAGAPLHLTKSLPRDFFANLDALVETMHARGVCHNDLHKEQNILVGADGFPHLIDFQLASLHPHRGMLYRSRVRDDFRHVEKHRRRYTRDGRAPEDAGDEILHGRGHGLKRRGFARAWRRTGKPLYNFITRRMLKTRDGEARRSSDGLWPEWTAATGERGH